jgi:hypothetical protein
VWGNAEGEENLKGGAVAASPKWGCENSGSTLGPLKRTGSAGEESSKPWKTAGFDTEGREDPEVQPRGVKDKRGASKPYGC